MRRLTANSRKVVILGSKYDLATRGQTTPRKQKLSRLAQDKTPPGRSTRTDREASKKDMPEEQLENFRALADFRKAGPLTLQTTTNDGGPGLIDIHNILDGTTQMDMSHAGSEFIEALQDGIEAEMERLGGAYMCWCAEADLGVSRPTTPAMVEEIKITVVDLYETKDR
ncbi:hypothetical protein C8R45DRAFT_928609 [Mycena sanguinolenta]|nr:hypothetical protein C8R45DRAFT_928609 [Mycena sanguinolenta]